MDSLLKDKNSVKVDMSGLEDLKLPENFGELGDSEETDEFEE